MVLVMDLYAFSATATRVSFLIPPLDGAEAFLFRGFNRSSSLTLARVERESGPRENLS